MSSEWSTGKLGEFVELKRGYDLPQAKRQSGSIPLVSSSGVTDRHNVAMVKGPGVVTGRYGTIGQVFYIEKDFWPLNTTLYVKDFKGNDQKFIHYFLQTLDFNAYSDKAAVPGVNRNHLHEAVVSIPPISVQVEIAAFLGALDAQITLLHETNCTLEAIAQALFKSWFVDFDPVHANIDRRIPEGMEASIASMFPNSFDETELGKTPHGWKWGTMADISTVGIGKTPPRKEQQWFATDNNHIPWVSIRDMGQSGIFVSATSEFLTQEAVQKFNVRVVPDHTVLMSFKMTIGRVTITDGELTTNEAIAHFNLPAEATISSEYLYLYLKNFNYSTLSSTSSIADAINSKSVRKIPILIPSDDILTCFQDKISFIFEQIKNSAKKIKTLSEIKQSMLPRLISGKFAQSKTPNINI